MREVLNQGLSIAIVGWKDSNHSRLTRQISSGDSIIFHQRVLGTFGKNIGLVVFTRFNNHASYERIKVGSEVFSGTFGTGEIKKAILSIKDLLRRKKVSVDKEALLSPIDTEIKLKPETIGAVQVPFVSVPQIPQIPADIIEKLVQHRSIKENAMTDDMMKRFAQKFKKEADKSNDGSVGKMVLGRIRRDCGINVSSYRLGQSRWIMPIISPGNKEVGQYRSTEKLQGLLAGPVIESDDPIVRFQNLIGKEPELLAELAERENKFEAVKAEHEKEVGRLNEKLKKVRTAQSLMEQLKNIVG